MILYEATVAGGAQFDGAAAATGLLDFTASYGFLNTTNTDIVPVIYGYGYDGGANTADVTVTIDRPGGGGTQQVVLDEHIGATTLFRVCNPGIIIPRTDQLCFQLLFTTANKTADASVTCWWGVKHL